MSSNDHVSVPRDINDEALEILAQAQDFVEQYLSTIEALRAEHERIRSALQDSHTVHANIIRGEIALTREQALHIAGATDYDSLRSSLSAAEERIAGLQEALFGLLDEHDTCDTGDGSPEGCTLLMDLTEVYRGSFPDVTATETVAPPTKCTLTEGCVLGPHDFTCPCVTETEVPY